MEKEKKEKPRIDEEKKTMSKHGTIDVTLRLPKPVAYYFLEDESNLAEYLTQELVELCLADVEAADPKRLMKKYAPDLQRVFQDYHLLEDHGEST